MRLKKRETDFRAISRDSMRRDERRKSVSYQTATERQGETMDMRMKTELFERQSELLYLKAMT